MSSTLSDTFVGQNSPPVPWEPPSPPAAKAKWSYDEAFKRNRGLITEEEQEKLRNSRVAIAGMGGVGGVHLITLARLGIGKFTIADPDVFEVANFNRQYGATISNLGRNKAKAMAELALDINPELDVRVYNEAIDAANVDEFFDEGDLFVDGLDFFAIDARRLVFRRAADRGIWAITAGPIGFSTAWLSFDPNGMSFDRYFDLRSGMSQLDQLVAFAVGLTPRATHLKYTDLREVKLENGAAPSISLACQLASGAAADQAIKILLDKPGIRPVPHFSQFDVYRRCYRSGRCPFGNRGWLQQLKRHVLKHRYLAQLAYRDNQSSQ